MAPSAVAILRMRGVRAYIQNKQEKYINKDADRPADKGIIFSFLFFRDLRKEYELKLECFLGFYRAPLGECNFRFIRNRDLTVRRGDLLGEDQATMAFLR